MLQVGAFEYFTFFTFIFLDRFCEIRITDSEASSIIILDVQIYFEEARLQMEERELLSPYLSHTLSSPMANLCDHRLA